MYIMLPYVASLVQNVLPDRVEKEVLVTVAYWQAELALIITEID